MKKEFVNQKNLEMIISFLEELMILMIENKHTGFLPGVKAVRSSLLDEEMPIEDRFDQAASLYKGMIGGAGSLNDWGISRENKIEQTRLNNKLHTIFDEIWERLGLSLKHLPSVDEGYPPDHIYWKIIKEKR